MSIRKDYNIDVLRLLDNLKVLAEKPKSLLGITFGYNRDEMAIQIDKIRASMPRELKDAASLARESERVIESAEAQAAAIIASGQRESERLMEEAQKEAARLVETARLQQEQMISESEVLKLAKAQSEEIRSAGERESLEMRRGAEKYAYELLSHLENSVGRVMSTLERGRAELEPITDRAMSRPDAREKTRV